MKAVHHLSVVVVSCFLLFLIVGCEHTTESTPQSRPLFSIDLQDGFQRDSVQIILDNQVIFDDTATTSLALSLAKRLTPTVSSGAHHIQVLLPVVRVQADTMVDVQDTLVVGANFNRSQNQLSLTVYHFWVMYR